MRVLYFIFVSAGGKGGHFHSLNHISRVIGKDNPTIRIISFGREVPPILKKNPYFHKHLFFSKTKFFLFFYHLYKEIKNFNADILHFFDAHSYNIFFPLSFIIRKKTVVNKCGGPNPLSYPIVPNLILFTEENKEWFLTKKEFNNTKIKVIPNRVVEVETVKYKEYVKNAEVFTILRICRIGTTYYQSILNGIKLVKELSKRNFEVKFYVIGKVTEELEYKQLKNESEGFNIEFITKDKYTEEASKMLYLADAVIGTGRSAMEACSLGLPTLMPSKQFDYPVLLTKSNFNDYFIKNFTDRVLLNNIDQEEILQIITNLLVDKDFYNNTSLFSKEVFKKHFDITKSSERYLFFYKDLRNQRNGIKTLKVNAKRSLSTMYRVFKGHF